MARIDLYLSEREKAYVKERPPGFIRGLVRWSMDKARQKEEAEFAQRQTIDEHVEKFVESA